MNLINSCLLPYQVLCLSFAEVGKSMRFFSQPRRRGIAERHHFRAAPERFHMLKQINKVAVAAHQPADFGAQYGAAAAEFGMLTPYNLRRLVLPENVSTCL